MGNLRKEKGMMCSGTVHRAVSARSRTKRLDRKAGAKLDARLTCLDFVGKLREKKSEMTLWLCCRAKTNKAEGAGLGNPI